MRSSEPGGSTLRADLHRLDGGNGSRMLAGRSRLGWPPCGMASCRWRRATAAFLFRAYVSLERCFAHAFSLPVLGPCACACGMSGVEGRRSGVAREGARSAFVSLERCFAHAVSLPGLGPCACACRLSGVEGLGPEIAREGARSGMCGVGARGGRLRC